jgi:hypothetical protein
MLVDMATSGSHPCPIRGAGEVWEITWIGSTVFSVACPSQPFLAALSYWS